MYARVVFFCSLIMILATTVGAQDVMRVHIIDVGQGSATLIEFPHGAALIDAGGEQADEFNGPANLLKYLKAFFESRQDLAQRQHPLDLLAITHPHRDHTVAVPDIIDLYTPANVIHNHQLVGSGIEEQNFAVDYIRETEADGYWIVEDRAVDTVLSTGKGITNGIIDPFVATSAGTDPSVTVLWGGVRNNRYWDFDDFADENNHSLVIRVDFGKSSILFTGDLEESIEDQEDRYDEAGIERIVKLYKDKDVLDTDVYIVGHHGSHNGGSNELVQLISPELAVISCGPPVKRKRTANPSTKYNAYNFGHPRKEAIDELETVVSTNRASAKDAKYFKEMKKPLDKRIEKAIYCTGWDGTVVLEGSSTGQWTIKELAGNPAFPSQ